MDVSSASNDFRFIKPAQKAIAYTLSFRAEDVSAFLLRIQYGAGFWLLFLL